jgi:REP-associated tyrosine transposase
MPQSLSSILIHLVFSTKNRQPLITETIESELFQYLGGIFRNCKCPSLVIGGDQDHIRTLFALSRNCSIAELVREIKSSSSKWLKGKGVEFQHFQRQTGYGAFSIGQSGVEELKHYIANQKIHHSRGSFEKMSFGYYAGNTKLRLTNDLFGIEDYLAHTGLVILGCRASRGFTPGYYILPLSGQIEKLR